MPRSPRGECTQVLDPSGDDCKARSCTARSLRKDKKMEPIIGIDEEGASPTKSLNEVKATDYQVRIA